MNTHRAVVWIQAEVHEINKHGECAGDPKHKVKSFPLAIEGADLNITIRKLNELLDSVKEQCKK